MDAPPVQYARTSDGLSIAYAVRGRGQPLLFLPGAFYHVQLAWQFPVLQRWLEDLSERFLLILMDPRGTGMSSRDVGDDHAREHYQRDLEAVVGSLRLERFVLMGISGGVDLAVDYCVEHPEQVSALVLGTSGEGKGSAAFFEMLPAQNWDLFLQSLLPPDRNPEERSRMIDLMRKTLDQRNYLLRRRALGPRSTVEELLPKLAVPILVFHARDYLPTPVEEGMKVARLSGGRLVLIDGVDWFGDAEQGIRAIEAFLEEVAPQASGVAVGAGVLSAREVEVLRLIAAGKSNPQIADELVISPSTVAKHVTNILAKTGAANRTEAALYARDRGLA
jgi:pimeloyl-ACP methyl ester carboxylesterase/DNA-binding CsgD family transcriptional regulator